MARRKPGPKPKQEKQDLPPFKELLLIVAEASKDLETALELDLEDADELAFLMEKVAHASGLLKGTVLILEQRGGKK